MLQYIIFSEKVKKFSKLLSAKRYLIFPDGLLHQFNSQNALEKKYSLPSGAIHYFFKKPTRKSLLLLGFRIPTLEEMKVLPIIEDF